MKNLGCKEKFIELRSQGFSFEKISKEINVSKPTLIKWSQEYSQEISNLIFFHSENLIEEFKLLRIHKIESLSRTLNRVLEELSKRNFENVNTKDLISIAFSLENKLRENVSGIECYSGVAKKYSIEEEMFAEKTFPILY
jgi:intein-encoded DNA endonuclease-like protein